MAKQKFDVNSIKALGTGAALVSQKDEVSVESVKKEKKHPGGRPPKSQEKKSTRYFSILFQEEDFEALSANAEMNDLQIAPYIKKILKQNGCFSIPTQFEA